MRPIPAFSLLLIVGATGSVIGALLDLRRFLFSWLVAFGWLSSLLVGLLILVASAHASRARWFTAVRRLAEVPMAAMPVLIPLAIPICLGAGTLYLWAGSLEGLPHEARGLIEHKAAWLNVPFFIIRTAFYLLLWSFFALRLSSLSLAQAASDADPEALLARMRRLSAGSLPALALTLTFASFDWLMSLEPTWLSTVYGIYFFAGGIVAALAVLVLIASGLRNAGLVGEEIAASHLHAAGKLLLAMVIFWAYIAFVQLLIIWIADEPKEVPFFLRRSTHGWAWVSALLGIVHFGIPFLLLLSRDLKRNFRSLSFISAWLLFAHWLDLYWLVIPVASEVPTLHLADLGTMLVIIGGAGLVASLRFRDKPLLATADPSFADALRYRGS